jgi:hypothetical protein
MTDNKQKGQVKIYCPRCCRLNEEAGSAVTWQWHVYVSSSLDKVNGWMSDEIKTHGGCRDSAADYRTTKCLECGLISTGDFASD